MLTQLAKTRRALFVEGADFQIIGKFALKLGARAVGHRRDFAVVPVEGFNPERIRSLLEGMEATLGIKISAMAVLDRDYRCDEECAEVEAKCRSFCDFGIVHSCKEIENFLLVPDSIRRAITQRIADRARRAGIEAENDVDVLPALNEFCESKESYVVAQMADFRRRYERSISTGRHDAEITQTTLEQVGPRWRDLSARLNLVSGKEALGFLSKFAQQTHQVSLTPTAIIDAMHVSEVPAEMVALVHNLIAFSSAPVK